MRKQFVTKRIAPAVIALLTAASVLAGCKGNEQEASSRREEQAASATQEQLGESADGEKEAGQGSPYETTPAQMRDLTAQQLVDEIQLGWNLGDTLDVCNADRDGDGKADETAETVDETLWGNVKTTKELLDNLKNDGINGVRIPVTWRDHTGEAPDYAIDGEWMDRVEEVVRYAYENEMYVILNMHHDGGGDPDFGAWIRNASDSSQKDEVMARYKAVWEQIARRFANYSDHLILESMNEVGFDDLPSEEAYALLNEMNQAFVDVVRGTGGNNATRHLLIAGYWTDIEATCNKLYQMPEDTVKDKLILSVHYYTPWEFCTTNIQNTWGTKADVKLMHEKIDAIYGHYTAKGIPVLIGEYGFGNNETASCIYFAENLVQYCHSKGIATFLWDNGGMYDRTNMKWKVEGLQEALARAVSGEDYKIRKTK